MTELFPYVRQQIVIALASGLATAALWWLVGRRARLRSSASLRAAATLAVLVAAAMAGNAAVFVLYGPTVASLFLAIALVFYALVLWLPLIAAAALLRSRVSSGRGDRLLAAACALAPLVGLYALFVEPNRLQVVEHRIAIEPWPADALPVRIVHVSDLQTVGGCARERRAIRLINDLQPDLIVVTGDFVAGPFGDPEPAVAAARAFFGALRAKHAVLLVPGHSETEALRLRVVAGLSVRYLRNEEFELDLSRDGRTQRLRLFGLAARGPRPEMVVPVREVGLATLVASHVPDVSLALDGRGVDLHLAGHTHGGQVTFPFLGAPLTLSALPRRYARGLHEIGDHLIHVSPGIGMEGHFAPRFRFLCPPEIDLLVLEGGG